MFIKKEFYMTKHMKSINKQKLLIAIGALTFSPFVLSQTGNQENEFADFKKENSGFFNITKISYIKAYSIKRERFVEGQLDYIKLRFVVRSLPSTDHLIRPYWKTIGLLLCSSVRIQSITIAGLTICNEPEIINIALVNTTHSR